MPLFNSFEKKIIRTIQEQAVSGERELGMLVKDILFESGKSAFVVCGDVITGGTAKTICSLLALADSGFQEAREAAVSFVSIMNYLVENRLLYLTEHEIDSNKALFYQESDPSSIVLQVTNSRQEDQRTVNTYMGDIGNGKELTIEETVKDGHPISFNCMGIELSNGKKLTDVAISYKVKNEMLRYLTSRAYPTLALSELVRNEFKTPEELASEKSLHLASLQVNKAQITLIVSIITLFVSFLSTFLNTFGLCNCIIVIVIVALSFVMGYIIKCYTSPDNKDNCD